MERKEYKRFHFPGPVLTRRIRGWKGLVSFINIGLSAAVVGLMSFNLLFLLARVELPTEIEPAETEWVERHTGSTVSLFRKDIKDYAPIVSKNIFTPNRKEWEDPLPVTQPSQKEELDETLAERSGLSLLGVVIAGKVKKALVKGKRGVIFLREGEEIEGYKVVDVGSKRVRMSLNGREFDIGLHKDITDLSGASSFGSEEPEKELELAEGKEPPALYEPGEVYPPREGLGTWRPSRTKP